MQNMVKEYGINSFRVAGLFSLLISPTIFVSYFLEIFEIYQLNQDLISCAIMAALLIIYFCTIAALNERLVGPFHDMVAVKYAIVIAVLFWIFYDLYMVHNYQAVYFAYQDLIVSRGIVWRDVAELPLYAQYPDAKPGLLLLLSGLRSFTLVIFATNLMRAKKDTLAIRRSKRKKISTKSVDELKANLHPSILNKYKNNQ